jgi:general secretion pathway protein A
MCDNALLTGYVRDLTAITPKTIRECTKELRLPGESKSSKAQKVRSGQRGKIFGKRALLYSCLILLLIPLFYPPVSTTLKGYLTNVINFYDGVFQQLDTPAHSYNAQEAGVKEHERASQNTTSSLNQLTSTDSKPSSDDIVPIDKSLGDESSNPGEQSFNPADCQLTISFGYNSNEVPETAYGQLEKCASMMLQNPSIVMTIKGYSDGAGSRPYNKRLSEFRANIVKSYLVGQGISPRRINALGMGEEDPLESNMTQAGRRANRRVEVEVVAESSN